MDTNLSLSERYVTAVARSVPAADRDEISAELRASIADQLDGRVEAGQAPEAAEYAVVAELGDPIAYAASLSGRPLLLIGPRYYTAWLRLLRLLLLMVVPTATLATGLVHAIGGGDTGAVIGAMIPVLITSTVHVGFWTTLAFAALERAGKVGDIGLDWTPDKLPRRAIPTARLADFAGTAVLFAILIGSVVWDRTIGWGQDHVRLLSADLWPGTMIVWFALLALGLAVEVTVVVRGRWNVPLALANTAIALVALIGAIALVWQDRVLDHDLMAHMRAASTPTTDVVQIVNIVLTVVLAGILVGLVMDLSRKLGLARAV
ncbi:permease prefix domain 1-containing protein [Microbacterium capsulatum]|uniref:Permease prefix domain 1-containing protein n=1 Tax=Microbacterium capsulatum TaxID=3041921 RepID=A0ABU0XKL6_9MICO|nr:permease prefix domain 1-containing protein [Microbacterium sp. ASV81]MDQ4215696.1 permease prefix domain 1-containing protein [Microbacterium sp. ASV81]